MTSLSVNFSEVVALWGYWEARATSALFLLETRSYDIFVHDRNDRWSSKHTRIAPQALLTRSWALFFTGAASLVQLMLAENGLVPLWLFLRPSVEDVMPVLFHQAWKKISGPSSPSQPGKEQRVERNCTFQTSYSNKMTQGRHCLSPENRIRTSFRV